MDYITLEKIVRDVEKPSRFEHSLGVVEVSEVLAKRFRLDCELAKMIAVFHDYARYMDGDEMLRFCHKHDIEMVPEEEESPMLLHGAVAAWYFPRITNNWDERTVKAIRHHTLASAHMGAYGAVLYVADYSEKGRRHLDDNDRLVIWGKPNLEQMVLEVLTREEDYSFTVSRRFASVSQECKEYLESGGLFERS